jgi:hypothetical protein
MLIISLISLGLKIRERSQKAGDLDYTPLDT